MTRRDLIGLLIVLLTATRPSCCLGRMLSATRAVGPWLVKVVEPGNLRTE